MCCSIPKIAPCVYAPFRKLNITTFQKQVNHIDVASNYTHRVTLLTS